VGPVTSPFDISNIQVARTVYIIAENSGGTLISTTGATGTPYIFGTSPAITRIQPGTNSLTVTFNPSVGGTSPVNHYYSYDSSGIPRVGQIQSGASTFTITDISAAKTVYVVAENPAGNLVSTGVSGTPYIFGDQPVISSILSGPNKLVVTFSQINKGTLPVTYYYSFDGSGRLGLVTSQSFDVSTTITRTVYIIADNSAGTIVSAGFQGSPYLLGDPPIVDNIQPGPNQLQVFFSHPNPGAPPITYYYSFMPDGSDSIGPVTSPFYIEDILEETTIYIVASNIVGNIISEPATGAPYLIGSPPVITNLLPGIYSIIVEFIESNDAVPPPYAYYYSLDGGDYILAEVIQSQLLIPDLTVIKPYTVTIIAENEAGFTLPSNMATGKPRPEGLVVEFTNNTYVPPSTGSSASGSTVSQDRRKFVNSSAFTISADLPNEEQIIQIKLQNKSRTGPGRVTGEDLVIKKRVTAIGRAAFSTPATVNTFGDNANAREYLKKSLTSKTIKQFSSKGGSSIAKTNRKTNRIRESQPSIDVAKMTQEPISPPISDRRISIRRESIVPNKRRTNRTKPDHF
jgi:hypothetical protein